MIMLQRWPVEWRENGCYGGGQFNGGRKVMLGGQFNGGRMVATEVVSIMEGEWSCYEVVTNGVTMVTLQRWLVYWKQNNHVREVASLMQGEWSCYRGCQFNGGRMVML